MRIRGNQMVVVLPEAFHCAERADLFYRFVVVKEERLKGRSKSG